MFRALWSHCLYWWCFGELFHLSFHYSAITWYKDNRPLASAVGTAFLNRGQVLHIEGAQISDAGVYKCVAVNSAGTAELFYSLRVHGKYWKT